MVLKGAPNVVIRKIANLVKSIETTVPSKRQIGKNVIKKIKFKFYFTYGSWKGKLSGSLASYNSFHFE